MEVPTPRAIYDELNRYVIGQHRAKQTVATAAYNHYKRIAVKGAPGGDLLRKSNILLIGPTGCGKTHIARQLARILDVPFAVCDATEYTEAGYYGKDVEVMVAELLFKTDQDVAAASRGIIFVDEVDKIARRSHGARTGAGARDIGGEGVQQGLLKLLEGREVFVPQNVTQHWNKHDFVQVDTTDILFICAGTFSDLAEVDPGRGIGFGGEDVTRKHRRVPQKALLEYGFTPEFLGRLPVLMHMHMLEEDDLLRILTEPPDSIIKEYKVLLGLDEVDLDFTEDGLRAIVQQATRRKLGARGLRSIVEEVMREIMFSAPERKGSTQVIDAALVNTRMDSMEEEIPAQQ